jgi:hypothetical protein
MCRGYVVRLSYDAGVPKPPLTLVPAAKPSPAEAVRTRVKKSTRPPGMLQCPVCGGRSVHTVRNGVIVQDGEKTNRGTLIAKDTCADCYPATVKMIPGGQGPKALK